MKTTVFNDMLPKVDAVGRLFVCLWHVCLLPFMLLIAVVSRRGAGGDRARACDAEPCRAQAASSTLRLRPKPRVKKSYLIMTSNKSKKTFLLR